MDSHSFKKSSHVSHETFQKLEVYKELLLKWQKSVNLISNMTIDDVWSRHFLDSTQLLSHIDKKSSNLLDFGSGAGFPGLVLAICGAADVHLVESDHKKCLFMKEVARHTSCSVTVHCDRIERVSLPKFTTITSRACSSLGQLFSYSSPFVSHETICLFPKGKNYSKELEEANKLWRYGCDTISSITDSEAAILKITDLQRREHETDTGTRQ